MLEPLFDSTWRVPLAMLSGLTALGFEIRSFRIFRLAFGDPDHDQSGERMVAAIRSSILAIGFLCFAGGFWYEVAWPIGFGIFFLAEEMVETGFMSIVLRAQRTRDT